MHTYCFCSLFVPHQRRLRRFPFFLTMTSLDATDRLRRLRGPGYLILGLAVAIPLIELFLSVVPWHPGVVTWRFGTMGLTAAAIGTPLTGLLFVFALALLMDDRPVAWGVAVISAVIALVLIVGAGGFVLDALQVKARVKPEALRQFTLASAQALVKLLVEGVAATFLAIAAFRSVRQGRRQHVRSAKESLVVGRSAAPSAAPIEHFAKNPIA